MRRSFLLVLLLVGCGGPQDPSGSGGAQAGEPGQAAGTGAQSGSAGASAAGGKSGGSGGSGSSGAASCSERWTEYDALAKSARLCDPNAAAPECEFTVVVLDACGCTVPANDSSPNYAPARQRLSKYADDCDFPEDCAACPSTLAAACITDDAGISRCEYQ